MAAGEQEHPRSPGVDACETSPAESVEDNRVVCSMMTQKVRGQMRASMELTPGPHGNLGGLLVLLCAWADSMMIPRVVQMPENPYSYVWMIE